MKRYLKLAGVGACLIVLVGFVYGQLHGAISAHYAKRDARRDAFRVLSEANSEAELREAAGDLGLFVSFPDKSWMAIRYKDSHANTGWSVAVALDSEGKWYQSSRHFCGTFRAHRVKAGKDAEMKELLETEGLSDLEIKEIMETEPSDVDRLVKSKTLTIARERLLALGFEAVDVE